MQIIENRESTNRGYTDLERLEFYRDYVARLRVPQPDGKLIPECIIVDRQQAGARPFTVGIHTIIIDPKRPPAAQGPIIIDQMHRLISGHDELRQLANAGMQRLPV